MGVTICRDRTNCHIMHMAGATDLQLAPTNTTDSKIKYNHAALPNTTGYLLFAPLLNLQGKSIEEISKIGDSDRSTSSFGLAQAKKNPQ